MIYFKTDEEIELIKISGDVLGRAHAEVAKLIRPGVTTKELDKVAEEFIRDNKGVPSFKGYGGFPGTLCVSPNDQIVHGMPSDEELVDGDILSVDCGVYMNGFHSDSAYTYTVGEVNQATKDLLYHTKESLYKGIEKAIVGKRMGDLSSAIQDYVQNRGYTVVRELVGHGVGKSLHEKPEVPNYGKQGRGPLLREGLVIAIEPMINLGKRNITQESDGWTIRTSDRKPSAHFEHTVAVGKEKAEVLTTFKYIEEVLQNG